MTHPRAVVDESLLSGRPSENGRAPTGLPRALTDLANAELFCELHADRLRHVHEQKKWLAWDGGRWRPDLSGEAERAATDTARELLRRAADLDGTGRKRAARWALASQSEPRLRAMRTIASTEHPIVLTADQLDADPYLLACANGTLELRTGTLRDADPGDLISRGTAIAYEPDAACPRWLRFLDEIFDGDAELIAFMARFTGYCLTGDTREQVVIVCHGTGANGKTTMIEKLKEVVGEHGVTAGFDTFARARGDRGPRNDLARLHRARLVVASESGEGRRLDEATVKALSGGDAVTARFLYGEHFEFRPQFKLCLVTNHRPRIDGDDDAIWRRLRLVPFEQSFLGREDPELSAQLDAELPGILAWAVRGCLDWQRDGLGAAAAVERATAAYREDEDVLGAFIAERCELGGEVEVVALRESYESFCRELGEKPMSGSALGRKLSRRGISRGGKGRRSYRGLNLR